MKKACLFAAITASVFLLVSASVWEGTAVIGDNFPENGFYLATNSFPVNTIVEVTNLENNRTASLIVSSSLENSGLLALLSKDAADYIGLTSMGRIRMRERDDQVNYSGFGERRFFSGDPNYNAGEDNEGMEELESLLGLDGYDLAMIAAELRPPEDWREPDPEYFISSILSILETLSVPEIYDIYETPEPPETIQLPEIYEAPVITVIPSVPQPPIQPSVSANSTATRFSAPIIQSFERGMYYVQIGAYRTTQTVESEILKVDKNLPVVIMRIESEDGPIYRVLIGPLNFGESGAILQRYKAIYKDAFLRVGK